MFRLSLGESSSEMASVMAGSRISSEVDRILCLLPPALHSSVLVHSSGSSSIISKQHNSSLQRTTVPTHVSLVFTGSDHPGQEQR